MKTMTASECIKVYSIMQCLVEMALSLQSGDLQMSFTTSDAFSATAVEASLNVEA